MNLFTLKNKTTVDFQLAGQLQMFRLAGGGGGGGAVRLPQIWDLSVQQVYIGCRSFSSPILQVENSLFNVLNMLFWFKLLFVHQRKVISK